MASKAPVEIREAETALRLAELPVSKDPSLSEHRVYMADQLVEIAAGKAATRFAESEREELIRARETSRLDARTREVDRARREASAAQSATAESRAELARQEDIASRNAAEAAQKAERMQRQIDDLNAEATDRGLVLTLGDVLFATGKADLNRGGFTNLDKLVVFLKDYPDREVSIEGHTDDVGSMDSNQALSGYRADAVKSYLVTKGIRSSRLDASGMGETRPIADNATESGRQQNRRVELIITESRATAS
jgi:outer membrane protein OmpA-like peptidoglycan-associated protein